MCVEQNSDGFDPEKYCKFCIVDLAMRSFGTRHFQKSEHESRFRNPIDILPKHYKDILTPCLFGSANRVLVGRRIRGDHRGALSGGVDRRGSLRPEAARFGKETARRQGSEERRVNIRDIISPART